MDDLGSLQIVDIALRGGAIALLLLITAFLVRDHGQSLTARLGALFAIGVASYAVCSSPGFATHASLWHAPILALCLGNPVVFWLFARALFDDGFELRWWHGALWTVPVVLGFLRTFVLLPAGAHSTGVSSSAMALIPLAFAGLAIAQSLAGWRGDLIEGRRRLRVFVTGASALYIAVIGAVELALHGNPAPALAGIVNIAGIVALSAVITLSLLRGAQTELLAPRSQSSNEPAPASLPGARSPGEVIERKLLADLERLMAIERAYRQEGLTIGSLALKLGIPEYKLRRLINQELGYRNFSAFLNRYRIDEAKAALADPTQAAVPILTIALDAGFQSLPPFNRAFKAETGLTPSDYRRRKVRAAET